MKFEPEAAAAYTGITEADTLDRLDEVLAALDADPGQQRLHSHRWASPPVWGINVPHPAGDLLVAWTAEEHQGKPAVVVVRYIGPA
jgi:hypothetical protein